MLITIKFLKVSYFFRLYACAFSCLVFWGNKALANYCCCSCSCCHHLHVCIFFVAGHFLDRVIELLIQQLKNNNDKERVKALFVVTHLVNSSENLIHSRVANLVTALRSMLGEHNVKVRETILPLSHSPCHATPRHWRHMSAFTNIPVSGCVNQYADSCV